MKYLFRYTPAIILAIFIIIFSWTKKPDRTWDRVINSDGKAYYAYLPAIFIYHDLQFRFVEEYESKYYPGNRSAFKEFRVPAGEKIVNKTFPGLAIVWLPFFLAGHVIALVEMIPADGYSLPYQYAIAFSALFFLWLGAWLLMRLLLKMGSDEKTAAFITTVVTLGTNIIYYSIVEGTMSHVYSFALITAFLYSSWNMLHRFRQGWFTLSLFLYVLICIIRPTNGLVILLIPFLAGTIEDVLSLINDIILLGKKIIWSLLPALVLIFLPFLLWKLQTGQWIVYTYGEERLHPLHPNIINILFSYNRGWFVYTPVAFISLFGFIGLFRKNRFSFYFLLTFLFMFIYVASCWWVWYYASKCGQRIFVDIYAVTGILLFYLYDLLRYRILKWVLSLILVAAVILNIFQFYQHRNWIYPPTIITKAIFCDSFFSTVKKSRLYIPEEAVLSEKSFRYDMEKYTDWNNSHTRYDSVAHSGKWSSRINHKTPFGIGIEARLDTVFTTGNRMVKVTGWALSPKGKTESTLVADFQNDHKSLSYNPFYLGLFVVPGTWTYFEAAFYAPRDLPEGSTCKVYFYNPMYYFPLYTDDVEITFLSLKDEPEYRRIEGVLLPF